MKVLRIILKKLREVLALLKMLDTEFRKIKRQKFVLLTILAACLFPIPLTVVIVHAKLNYDVLLMFVMEFGFFLVLPIVLGIIASILFPDGSCLVQRCLSFIFWRFFMVLPQSELP